MTLSIKKFESLIKESGLSDTKFAEKLGKNKNILYKYRNQKNYELNDLRTDFAIEISRVFKIDFYYFYDDSKPLSLNPAIDYPVVDSTQISELKRTINNLVEGMAKLTKKSEKSNRGYLEVIVDSASNAVSEFISATIKLNNIGKKYLNVNADLAIIMRASSDALIAYAKRKSMDFTQKINTIDCSEAKDLEVALNDVYEFKKEKPYHIEQKGNKWIISGKELEKLLKMTRFNSDEAALRFAKKLQHLGVDEELKNLGAKNGDIVSILDQEFEYEDRLY